MNNPKVTTNSVDLITGDFEIKRLKSNDIVLAHKLIRLFEEVFEKRKTVLPKVFYLKQLLATPNFIAYVAIYKKQIIGGLTAYELPMLYSESSEMFIYDIAVMPEYQRKGVGKKLLHALQLYCKKRGIKEIFVAANEEDNHALKFYNSCKGREERVRHFSFKVR